MLSGVYRNTLLDRVVYGRPAADVLAELLDAYGKRRALVVSTRSLSGPQGLGTGIAEGLGERCVGLFGRISAHSPRDDVIAAALSYGATSNGIIPWKERPQSFRKGVISRIPPLNFRPEEQGL